MHIRSNPTERSDSVKSQMPLVGGPLSQSERDLIRAWINGGAPND